MAKTKKGMKVLILEIKGKQFIVKDLEKLILNELKALGIKYADDVNIYLNTEECIAYCVANNNTYKIKIQ